MPSLCSLCAATLKPNSRAAPSDRRSSAGLLATVRPRHNVSGNGDPPMQNLITRRQWLGLSTLGAFAIASPLRAAAASSRYATRVLSKKPVGYWRLGEAAGPTANDLSGNNRHGTFQGTPQFHEPGALARDPDFSVKLDGNGAFIEVPDDPAFSIATSGKGLTVEAWMRPDAIEFAGETTDPYFHWLGKSQNGQHEWAFRFYSRNSSRPNRLSAYAFNLTGGLGSGGYAEDPVTPGQWIHLVATFDPYSARDPKAGVSLYKNGVLRKGPALAGSTGTYYKEYQVIPTHGTAPLRFGTAYGKNYLNGALDEIAIYPGILSAAEIKEHYILGSKG